MLALMTLIPHPLGDFESVVGLALLGVEVGHQLLIREVCVLAIPTNPSLRIPLPPCQHQEEFPGEVHLFTSFFLRFAAASMSLGEKQPRWLS